MSWRLILVALIAAAGAAAVLGLRLGDWLVAHGPVATAQLPNQPAVSPPVLDADGRPYTAQPPQPLVNGRQAVPEPPPAVAWEINPEGLSETLNNPLIATATTSISLYQAKQLAQGGDALVGIADVGDLIGGGNIPLQPVEAPGLHQPGQSQAGAGTTPAWQADLRRALAACESASFFDRPSCTWAARNQYCGANNAWGQVDDCPARNF